MTQRSSARSGGATRTAVRRPFSVALAGIAMAVVLIAVLLPLLLPGILAALPVWAAILIVVAAWESISLQSGTAAPRRGKPRSREI